ncbi:MAG: tripartite tricarboxylate transporter permease [Desulfobacterales bacterium]|nr:tripartite tricarboxylate transporter permease [Desulfobacterales bacterium]
MFFSLSCWGCVLPGLGPTAAMSLLLPATFHTPPVTAVIMLAGIYYGAMYGGSTTSILVNIPGEAASVMTCLDGYQMARQGKAGRALGICAFGSFIAGTLGLIGLTLVAPPLAQFALKFGPPEYFALMCMGLVVLSFLTSTSMIRSLMMACFGVILGTVGIDTVSGSARFTFGVTELLDGIGLVPLVMGLFGISEILVNLEQGTEREIFKTKVKGLLPTLADWMQSKWALLRGTVIGFWLGILPGGGAVLSSFVAYAVEKRVSRHPEKFGTGIIEGVAAPEAANNSAAQAAFIPLLTLGLPANVVMALLLGALILHGVTPGPLLMTQNPDIFWGVIASMYLGNIMLLVLNLPLIGLWVQLLRIPYPYLMPLIIIFCILGAYSVANSLADVFFMFLSRRVLFQIRPDVLARQFHGVLYAADQPGLPRHHGRHPRLVHPLRPAPEIENHSPGILRASCKATHPVRPIGSGNGSAPPGPWWRPSFRGGRRFYRSRATAGETT